MIPERRVFSSYSLQPLFCISLLKSKTCSERSRTINIRHSYFCINIRSCISLLKSKINIRYSYFAFVFILARAFSLFLGIWILKFGMWIFPGLPVRIRFEVWILTFPWILDFGISIISFPPSKIQKNHFPIIFLLSFILVLGLYCLIAFIALLPVLLALVFKLYELYKLDKLSIY